MKLNDVTVDYGLNPPNEYILDIYDYKYCTEVQGRTYEWDKYVWYSKYYDQLIISDQFNRCHTCREQPLFHEYVLDSFVFIGEM